jgi:hypothetical protein
MHCGSDLEFTFLSLKTISDYVLLYRVLRVRTQDSDLRVRVVVNVRVRNVDPQSGPPRIFDVPILKHFVNWLFM